MLINKDIEELKIYQNDKHDGLKTKYWLYGFSDVKEVESHYAVHYLTKYISKSKEDDRLPVGRREIFASPGLNYKKVYLAPREQIKIPKGWKKSPNYTEFELFYLPLDNINNTCYNKPSSINKKGKKDDKTNS